MSDIAISAEHVSKKYNLGTIGSGTLFRDLNMYWAKMRGKPNPYARIGESGEFNEGEHLALNDVSFEIKQGDAVGIIGKNGAGKSTLLKVLSRVTTPTSGQIKVKGRIASLLEVGTGFHPEMTGKENIFLNGAILGMNKSEIRKKFDEIVEFAGIEKYIDTPVKRYSSGMYVRLAFGVAAHLEPEILIVDEVLAVGDAEFQKKCLGKMNDVSKNEGRTVLFVSHNMGAVLSLCSNGILLKKGKIALTGKANEIVTAYNSENASSFFLEESTGPNKPSIYKVEIDEKALNEGNLKIKVHFKSPFDLDTPIVGIVIYSLLGMPLFGSNARIHNAGFKPNTMREGFSELIINNVPLHTGTYKISAWLGDKTSDYDSKQDVLFFDFMASNISSTNVPDPSIVGSINLTGEWKLHEY